MSNLLRVAQTVLKELREQVESDYGFSVSDEQNPWHEGYKAFKDAIESDAEFCAAVRWSPDDILALRPNWSSAQAADWLHENEKHIRNRLTELGWEVIKDLLPTED